MTKPELELVGLDGNAFAILGRAKRVAQRTGWTKEEVDKMLEEAMSGDYDHLLQTMVKYFEAS